MFFSFIIYPLLYIPLVTVGGHDECPQLPHTAHEAVKF